MNIGTRVKVLDHGFVELVDVFGSDTRIAQAARVSYKGAKRKSQSSDAGLIDYMMRKRHTSPFEMAELLFVVRLPIFVARQWIRHRTASVNELSGRYSEMELDFHRPDVYRGQDTVNKQGSKGEVDVGDETIEGLEEVYRLGSEVYGEMLAKGVSKEMAREHLPLSTYTEWYWKIDLHNLFHFLKLRTDPHAQQEIRQYARVMERAVETHFPNSYRSWVNHVRDAVTFSADEMEILSKCLNERALKSDRLEWHPVFEKLPKSRKQEFVEKIGGVTS